MGFNFGAGHAGLAIGQQIADNQPPSIFSRLLDAAGNLGDNALDGAQWLTTLDDKARQAIIDGGQAATRAKNRPKPKKRKPAVDPYAGIMQQLMGGGSGSSSVSRMSRKEQEKAINAAILAARSPYDQAIGEARGGLKDALSINKRLTTGLKPDIGGSESRNEAYKQQVDQESQAQVAQAMADADMSKFGTAESGGEAAQRLAQAADGRIASTTAQAAALKKGSDQQAVESGVVAGSIGDFIKGEEAQTRGDLMKQAQKQVQRLQKERAAAIAQARAAARAGIVDTNATNAQMASEAQQANIDAMLKIMGMRSEDSYRNRSLALQQQEMRQKAAAAMQPKPLDIGDIIAMVTAQTKQPVIDPTTKSPVMKDGVPQYGPVNMFNPQQIQAYTSTGNPQSLFQTPQNPYSALSGSLLDGLKGLFR